MATSPDYGIIKPELVNAFADGMRQSQLERQQQQTFEQQNKMNQMKLEMSQSEMERLKQERQMMLDFQDQLKASGKDTNLETYFDKMIETGNPDFVEKALQGKQKLQEQKQFAEIMGLNQPQQQRAFGPEMAPMIADRIQKLAVLGTPQAMQTAKILQDQLEMFNRQKPQQQESKILPPGAMLIDNQGRQLAANPYTKSGTQQSQSPVKLKQGEIYDEATDKVVAVPGSDLFIKQSQAHGKDYKALNSVINKLDQSQARIDKILDPKNRSAFEGNFGGYNAYVTSKLPGNLDMAKTIESFKSDLKNAGLEMMRSGGSIGQITQQEWPIIEQLIAGIDYSLSEEEAKNVLLDIKNRFNNIKEQAKDAYATQWGDTQYFKEPSTNKIVSGTVNKASDEDKAALAWANANPNDPRSAAIKKHLGVK